MQHPNRRQFVQAATATAIGLGTVPASRSAQPKARSLIQIVPLGGPSQLETFDPKPLAPVEVRGPFRSIPTKIPGVRFGEHFPRLASLADQLLVLRSLHHDQPPIHETGLQLLQTGSYSPHEPRPHFGILAGDWRILPGPIEDTGVAVSRGQAEDWAASRANAKPQASFAENCREAVRLVEGGVRVVTVNMFTTVFDTITWDCHANGCGLPATLADYADLLSPMLDECLANLIESLRTRGLLDSTLVMCIGEMGRTPKLNGSGGRDHWTGCWSGILAGGDLPRGGVLGESDANAAEPSARPITPQEVFGSVCSLLGVAHGSVGEGCTPLPELA